MKRKKEKVNVYFLISVLLLLVVGVSYAYLSTSLNITGEVTGRFLNSDYIFDPAGNQSLTIDKPIINIWKDGHVYKYQYKFNIKNIGLKNIDNFIISLTYNNKINNVNIWNYDSEIKGKVLNVINKQYNLKPNQSLEVGFILESMTNDLKLIKVKLDTETNANEIDPSKFEITFHKTNSWGNYVYQYNVTVTNKTGHLITYWQISLMLSKKTMYKDGWNAIFEESDEQLIIKNESYNGKVENGKSVTFGLQIETDIKDFMPANYKIMIR